MSISVIIPIYGFDPKRQETLATILKTVAAQDLKGFELLIVEQEHPFPPHSHDLRHAGSMVPGCNYFRHLILPTQARGFNKSWCMNAAAKVAMYDELVFLDADMLFGSSFFSKIRNFAEETKLAFFLCWANIAFLPGRDEPIPRVVDRGISTAGGAFYIDRSFFWDAGGMNENYFGYGGEDNDLWVRVNRRLGDIGSNNVTGMQYALVHCYHDRAEPSEERFAILNRTIQSPGMVVLRLVAAMDQLGSVEGPFEIDMSDIVLNQPGVETKDGKGLL